MNLPLRSESKRFIQTRVRKYGSAAEVVEAGLAAIKQQETFGDFASGEMNELLKEGERSIAREGTVNADQVFLALKRSFREIF